MDWLFLFSLLSIAASGIAVGMCISNLVHGR
jgi:hypothetical protein